jgi:ketosteroid isomerase-like protein
LRKVYSVDCPCLRGDGDAIRQLLKDDAVWIGASTSIRVKRFEKVNDRLWIVVAEFIASPFRIETESGDLVRAVDGRTKLFRFVLARPTTGQGLVLGFAAPLDEG